MTLVATLTGANVVARLRWTVVRFHITDPADRTAVEAAARLARAAAPRCGGTVVVAVDGPSGSGKTTYAAALAAALDCPLLPMDTLYPGWDGLAAGVERLTREVLAPIAGGEPAAYRRWDWHRDAFGESVEVAGGRWLVIDGCGASAGPARRYAAVRVWLDADAATRRRRGVARDGAAYEPHWERWASQEAALFAADRTRERADVVVHTGPTSGPP